jgi:hypothetical protein
MDVSSFLEERRATIVGAAAESLSSRNLAHYRALGPEETFRRLQRLFDLVVEGARTHQLLRILEFAQEIGRERFGAGFDFVEVQAAFSTVEEEIWRAILGGYPQAEQGHALGLVATLLGAAKDRLSSTYLSLATRTNVKSLDLQKLFSGTQNTGGGEGVR